MGLLAGADAVHVLAYGVVVAGIALVIWLPLSALKTLRSANVYLRIYAGVGVSLAALHFAGGYLKPRAAGASTQSGSNAISITPGTNSMRVTADRSATEAAASANPQAGSGAGPTVSGVDGKVVIRKSDAVLGAPYMDEVHGYLMQFPAGWTIKTFTGGQPWVLDATDGKDGLISVGFSPFPAQARVEQINLASIAKGIRSRPGTTLDGQGYASIDGRRSAWAKSTGPLGMTNSIPRMTVVHYLLPLQDGRALELRVAARPDQFDRLAPLMKQSVQTFRLMSAPAPSPTPAAPR